MILDNYIQVALAGGIAESKVTGKRSKLNGDDLQKCASLIDQYWGRLNKVSNKYFEFMTVLTESTVASPHLWKTVKKLAKQLLKNKTLTLENIEKIYYDNK